MQMIRLNFILKPEAATRGVLCKKVFLECNFIKKETLAQVFSCEFCEISKNTFFTEHVWATASIKSVCMSVMLHIYRNLFQNLRSTLKPFSFYTGLSLERYPDNRPRAKLPPVPVRIGVWVKVRVSFRVGGKPDNSPGGKLLPSQG